MFIAFIVICMLGIFAGALILFLGLALLSTDIKRLKAQKEQEQQNNPVEVKDEEQVSELSNEDLEKEQKLYEKAHHQSPLPYLFVGEGACLFVASAALFAIKMLAENKMTWYVLLACFVGFIVVSFVVDCIVMSYYIPALDEERSKELASGNSDNNIADSTDNNADSTDNTDSETKIADNTDSADNNADNTDNNSDNADNAGNDIGGAQQGQDGLIEPKDNNTDTDNN